MSVKLPLESVVVEAPLVETVALEMLAQLELRTRPEIMPVPAALEAEVCHGTVN